MVTQFITIEVSLNNLSVDLQPMIEARLKRQGEPLRWAITAIQDGSAQVEAVVLQDYKPE
jgi:hypothetical protein